MPQIPGLCWFSTGRPTVDLIIPRFGVCALVGTGSPAAIFGLIAIIVAGVTLVLVPLARAQSVFTLRPDDARAVDFTKEGFGASGDGVGDDADALQNAINRVQETTR